jgi:archaeosine synthase
MLEPERRDGAARILSWSHGGLRLATPLALALDAPGLPAPPGEGPVLARAPVPGRVTVVTGGSRFRPGAADGAWIALDDDLPYAPAGGADLLAAGHAESLAAHVHGRAFVAVDPAGALPDDAEVVALANARAYADNPYTLTQALTTLRANAGPERLLYLPGCGLPQEIALLAYAGVDLFDDAAAVLAARQGSYLTPEGALPDPGDGTDLVAHARAEVQREVRRVQLAIRAGKLRELAEQRSRATPNLAAHIRRFDKEAYDFFEARAPLLRGGPLYTTSKESLERPEVERYRRRLASRYQKPASARVLCLLPCSATKPYSESKTHRILGSALERVRNVHAVHTVVLTSPLGVVPRELERCYPAAQYDLPVTGHWDEDEKLMIRDAVSALLARSRYEAVVVHLDEVESEIAAPVLPDHFVTGGRDPLARESLDELAATLNKLGDAAPRVGWRTRALDDLASLARYQFGDAGLALVEGADVKGKDPFLRLVDAESGLQLAMVVPDRGYLSLAPEGGKRLLEAGGPRVEIDDFRPKGTVFAVGVKGADAGVLVEDDVILTHKGEFRGVGRALAPGVEMGRMKKGACVAVRHKEAA